MRQDGVTKTDKETHSLWHGARISPHISEGPSYFKYDICITYTRSQQVSQQFVASYWHCNDLPMSYKGKTASCKIDKFKDVDAIVNTTIYDNQ